MEQRLENSTLIALRELRGYEKERQLAERRAEEARQARERKQREQKAEEAAREQALEKQLRTDLQRAEEEIRLLKQEADRRSREANHALQAWQALTSVPQAPASPGSSSAARRGSWLVAAGGIALLASAFILLIGVRRSPSMPAETSRRNPWCPVSTVSAPSPTSASAAPAGTAATLPPAGSGPVENSRQRPPIPRPRTPGLPHAPRKPNPPSCDGNDPLCGLTVNSMAP
jgi:hypothetical protein